MKAVLHPYQETAAGWLRERPEAALLLDMGLGKTLIALTALVDLATVGEDGWPALVIAPLMTARHCLLYTSSAAVSATGINPTTICPIVPCTVVVSA